MGGDANHRLAAFGLTALVARITGSYSPFHYPSPSSASLHSSLLRFHDASPWHYLPYTIANAALLDALDHHAFLHVVDIGISLTTQWPTFIEALATRTSGPPSLLRLTSVTDPRHSSSDSADPSSASEIQRRLEHFARTLNMALVLHTVSVPLEELTSDDLNLSDGEALAICCQFRLHRVSNDTQHLASTNKAGIQYSNSDDAAGVQSLSPRDALLKRLHGMHPEVLILSENDTDQSSDDFLTRFKSVIDFGWNFLDSTAAAFRGRDCEEQRRVIEEEAALVPMLNNVAWEGAGRLERNQGNESWREQMMRAGFHESKPKEEMVENARTLLKKYDNHWNLALDERCCSVLLRWKDQPTTFSSIWKCSAET